MMVFFSLQQAKNRKKYGEILQILDVSCEKFMKEIHGGYHPVITLQSGYTTGRYLFAHFYDGVWVEVPDIEYAEKLRGRYAPVP